jgi:hypothetical protein
MKKFLILVVLIILALTINLPDNGITGLFVKVGITGLALAKEILKTILTFALKLLG